MFLDIRNEQDIETLTNLLHMLLRQRRQVYVEVGIQRSHAQNRKFHALCREIAALTGHTPSEVKQMVKAQVLGDAERSTRYLSNQMFANLIEAMEYWRQTLIDLE